MMQVRRLHGGERGEGEGGAHVSTSCWMVPHTCTCTCYGDTCTCTCCDHICTCTCTCCGHTCTCTCCGHNCTCTCCGRCEAGLPPTLPPLQQLLVCLAHPVIRECEEAGRCEGCLKRQAGARDVSPPFLLASLSSPLPLLRTRARARIWTKKFLILDEGNYERPAGQDRISYIVYSTLDSGIRSLSVG